MKKAKISRKARTSKSNWLSIQEIVGFMDLSTTRASFILHYEPYDEEVWKLECKDHDVRFSSITKGELEWLLFGSDFVMNAAEVFPTPAEPENKRWGNSDWFFNMELILPTVSFWFTNSDIFWGRYFSTHGCSQTISYHRNDTNKM